MENIQYRAVKLSQVGTSQEGTSKNKGCGTKKQRKKKNCNLALIKRSSPTRNRVPAGHHGKGSENRPRGWPFVKLQSRVGGGEEGGGQRKEGQLRNFICCQAWTSSVTRAAGRGNGLQEQKSSIQHLEGYRDVTVWKPEEKNQESD